MAKFTVAVPVNFEWRGCAISGAAGATHRIPDALYDEFVSEFVTGRSSASMPGLAWISVDEQTAVGGEHPNLAAHDTLGLATQSELDTHAAAGDPHTAYALDADLASHEAAADPHAGYVKENDANWTDLTDGGATTLHSHTGGSGAPTDADYLVGTAHAGLSAEIVVGTSPGGELGGTWASPTVDSVHSGSAHHAQSHGNADHTSTFIAAAGVTFENLDANGDIGSGAAQVPAGNHTHPGGSEAFPVGSVFIAVVSTNPATLLGYGTWAAFAAGRVLVGIDAGQTEFDTVEETGGAKTHTLTSAEMPAHAHDEYNNSATTGGLVGWAAQDTSTNTASLTGYDTGSTGGGGAHNNLQPYIVVYMYKRTA